MARQAKLINGKLVEFEIRDLVDFYDPILRTPTKPFVFDETPAREVEFYAYSMAMMLTHYHDGLGLSANQVGWDLRICALNLGSHNIVLFNPEIVEASEPVLGYFEGCLSYPGLLLKIPRSQKIKVKFQAPAGNWLEETFEGLTAVCVQHELDHLDGIVYSDKVSSIAFDRAKRKVKTNLKKMRRFTEANKKMYDSIPEQVSNENMQRINPANPGISGGMVRQAIDNNDGGIPGDPSQPKIRINFPQIDIPDVALPKEFSYKTADS